MTTAPYPQVTNELLSAYIDEAVSEEERRLIEQAVAEDPDVAWRLESLRATVRLLRELPAISLPRSFVLTPEQVGQMPAVSQQVPKTVTGAAPGTTTQPSARRAEDVAAGSGFWHDLRRGWGRFWQGGSPALRNAMAASFAVLLALLVTPRFLANSSFVSPGSVQTVASQAQTQPAAQPEAAAEVQATSATQDTAKHIVPDTAEAGSASGAAESAAAPTTGAAVTPVQPTAAKAPVVAQADVAPGAAADSMVVQGGVSGAPGAVAQDAPPAAAPRPAMAAQSGGFALDQARDQAGSIAAAPAAGARGSDARTAGAAAASVAPAPAAGTELTAAFAATPVTESAAAPATIEPANEPLADADMQESPATPVATIAVEPTAKPAAADPASTVTDMAATQETASAATIAATSAAVANAQAATGPEQSAAGEQEGCAVAVPCEQDGQAAPALVVAPAAATQQAGMPHWIGLAIQTAAVLAALATLVFGILWWRSRLSEPHS